MIGSTQDHSLSFLVWPWGVQTKQGLAVVVAKTNSNVITADKCYSFEALLIGIVCAW